MDGMLQIQDDGGSITRQNGMETSSLWSVLHWEQQGIGYFSQFVHQFVCRCLHSDSYQLTLLTQSTLMMPVQCN